MSHLRQLYASEKDCLVRLAPSLSHKALYPSNSERRNVKLVLKLYDEITTVGVNHFGPQAGADVSGTAKFMRIILRMWNILNVKSTHKCLHKRDCSQTFHHLFDYLFSEMKVHCACANR
jgi:hypothetical protein